MEAVLGKPGQQNNTLPQAMQRRVGVVGRQAPPSKLKKKTHIPIQLCDQCRSASSSLCQVCALLWRSSFSIPLHSGTQAQICITPALLAHSTATTQALKATVSLRELRYVASPRCVGTYSFSVLLLQNDGCCIARCAAAHVFVERFLVSIITM